MPNAAGVFGFRVTTEGDVQPLAGGGPGPRPAHLASGIACILRKPVVAGATPERALAAIGARFLAVTGERTDGSWAVQLGERGLALPLDGELRLAVDGAVRLRTPLAEIEPPFRSVARAARAAGGLVVGHCVVAEGAVATAPSGAVMFELRGPGNALLVGRVDP